jgi:peptide/nickel transport system substrate-binding protein
MIDMHVAGNVAHWNIMECGSGGTCMSPTSPFSNGLVHYNGETSEQLDIRGDLATGWTVSDGGTRYLFDLPEDARWHDGMQITSDDVVFSINEMLRSDAPRPRSGQIRPYVESAEAIGPYQVQIDLNFASSAFLAFLATDFMKMWPQHHVGTDPASQLNMRLEENILGSGPFKMVEHQKDVAYRWEKNEDYFKDGLPYLDGMNYYIINDSQSILGAYKAEQVLMTVYLNSNLNVREGQELQDDREGKGRVFFAGPTLWHGMLINTEKAPFDDVRVRRALNLILHRQAFNEIFGAGEYLIGSPLPPDQWFGRTSEEWESWPGLRQTDAGDKHPDDIAEAQRLMAEAGYEDGFETTILAANFLSFPDMAQVAANQMERWLNIKATVQPEEPAAGYVRYESGDWSLGFHGNGILVMDPDQLVAGSYLSKATRNYSGWEPPKVRELYDAQIVETDTEKRRQLVLELGDYLADEDTHVVITTWAMLVPYVDNRIKNYNIASGFANHTNKEHLWYEE